MQVDIQIKTVYGVEKAYPVNPTGNAIAAIARTKTLTRDTLEQVLKMGMTVVEIDRHGRACRTYRAGEACNLPMVG